jgi:hypothetical protein
MSYHARLLGVEAGICFGLERFKETCSRLKRQRRYLKNQAWGSAPGIQIAMQTSAEGAIQLALIQLVSRK